MRDGKAWRCRMLLQTPYYTGVEIKRQLGCLQYNHHESYKSYSIITMKAAYWACAEHPDANARCLNWIWLGNSWDRTHVLTSQDYWGHPYFFITLTTRHLGFLTEGLGRGRVSGYPRNRTRTFLIGKKFAEPWGWRDWGRTGTRTWRSRGIRERTLQEPVAAAPVSLVSRGA